MLRLGLISTALAALAAGQGGAQTVVALSGDRTLATIDAQTRKVTGTVDVTGFDGRLLGIDVRPADGMLYGLGADGTVVTIDPASGRATAKSKLTLALPADAKATVDFNPVADALRIMAADGTNLRAKIEAGTVAKDGGHAFAAKDMHAGETPNIVAGAYTNSHKGAEKTALYVIDATIAGLIRQDPPNDGTLAAIGKLGTAGVDPAAFDISSDGKGGNQAWLLAGGTLYQVDLGTGAATAAGQVDGIAGGVRDIAILPQG